MRELCSVELCGRDRTGRQIYCTSHYSYWKTYGKRPTKPLQVRGGPVLERWLRRVNKTDTCWLWTGIVRADGYGSFTYARPKKMVAHKWGYEQLIGPVPLDLQLDHLCRVRNCVNPAHLEPVTQTENVRRGVSPSAQNFRKTHCKRGHEFTPENTYVWSGQAGRNCRTCRRERQASKRNMP